MALSKEELAAKIAAKMAELKAKTVVPQPEVKQPVQQVVKQPTVQQPSAPKLTSAELMAKAKAILAEKARLNQSAPIADIKTEATPSPVVPVIPVDKNQITSALAAAGMTSTNQINKNEITFDKLNPEQKQAVTLAGDGKSFCLTGPAGTGKTTTCRCISTTLYESGIITRLNGGTKNLTIGSPSVVVVSYTNVAVSNIKEALPEEFKRNCLTIHKLLEYAPNFYMDVNEAGEPVKRVEYIPKYGILGEKLPNITHCIIEEAGSVPKWLFEELEAALPEDCTFIFLGDIEQLPPAFDDGILGYKLVELESRIVRLKEVYRQALRSPIIKLAHRILKGTPIADAELKGMAQDDEHGRLTLVNLKVGAPEDDMLKAVGSWLAKLVMDGTFVQGRDVVLCPFNVRFGTNELSKYIAQARNLKDNNPVFEIIAGRDYFKHYYAVGDIVYFNRATWIIQEIRKNPVYAGIPTKRESINMDRWGRSINGEQLEGNEHGLHNILTLDQEELDGSDEDVDIKQQSSHEIVMVPAHPDDYENETTCTISAIGDINSMYLACALTVHKAQGSEWQNVYFIMHSCHSVMAYRELLYTATTRARKGLTLIYEGENPKKRMDSIFQKGVIKQKIKGNSLEAKLLFFKSKVKANEIKARLAKQREDKEKLIADQVQDEFTEDWGDSTEPNF